MDKVRKVEQAAEVHSSNSVEPIPAVTDPLPSTQSLLTLPPLPAAMRPVSTILWVKQPHPFQAIHLASLAHADADTVVAALVRDIGQFVPGTATRALEDREVFFLSFSSPYRIYSSPRRP